MEVFAYRNLGVRNREEFERMTLSEFFLQVEAYNLRKVDEIEMLHLQAFLNQTVQATTGSKKNPKPKYQSFKDFYDAQEKEEEIRKRFEKDYKPKKTFDKKQVEQARRINDFGKFLKGGMMNGGKL